MVGRRSRLSLRNAVTRESTFRYSSCWFSGPRIMTRTWTGLSSRES